MSKRTPERQPDRVDSPRERFTQAPVDPNQWGRFMVDMSTQHLEAAIKRTEKLPQTGPISGEGGRVSGSGKRGSKPS